MKTSLTSLQRLLGALAVALLALTAIAGTTVDNADAAPRIDDDITVVPVDIDIPDIFIPINFAPQYNNYFTCFNNWVYTDFVDWNDPDEDLVVTLVANTAVGWRVFTMDVSGPGGHGVFFYEDLNAYGGMSWGWVKAKDPHGASSPWVAVSC